MPVRELTDANTDGTRLGQSSTDKLGFYGLTTPIVQPAVIAAGTDATSTQASLNLVITALKNLGLIASS